MPGAHLRYGMEAVPYELPYCVRFYVIFYLWVKFSLGGVARENPHKHGRTAYSPRDGVVFALCSL